MNADDIEHGILRCNRGHPMSPGPQFSSADPRLAWAIDPVDVRIHFALNCAGRSCPPIQVYSPQNLDSQLDLAARNFINQDISFDQGTHKVQLSTIFKWFAKDFGGRQGILDFLIEHLQDGDRKSWLRDNEEKIKFQYKAYDWRLNAFEMGPTFEKNWFAGDQQVSVQWVQVHQFKYCEMGLAFHHLANSNLSLFWQLHRRGLENAQ